MYLHVFFLQKELIFNCENHVGINLRVHTGIHDLYRNAAHKLYNCMSTYIYIYIYICMYVYIVTFIHISSLDKEECHRITSVSIIVLGILTCGTSILL